MSIKHSKEAKIKEELEQAKIEEERAAA